MIATDQELLEAIARMREVYPHWRFGQTLSNLAAWADVQVGEIEDADLLQAALSHLDQVAQRTSGKSESLDPTQG